MNTYNHNLLQELSSLYPSPRSELNFSNDYELLVSVVLSAQCTDKKVNQVTAKLFPRYPTFEQLSRARLSTLEELIREVNYYKTKSKNIKELARQVVVRFNGELPSSREDLESLPGVGRKTASVVLSEKGIEPAIAVDTHVFRVAKRLGLSEGRNREVVEQDLMKAFPSDVWQPLHHWLILHGRRVCKAQRPLCKECTLVPHCPSSSIQD